MAKIRNRIISKLKHDPSFRKAKLNKNKYGFNAHRYSEIVIDSILKDERLAIQKSRQRRLEGIVVTIPDFLKDF